VGITGDLDGAGLALGPFEVPVIECIRQKNKPQGQKATLIAS